MTNCKLVSRPTSLDEKLVNDNVKNVDPIVYRWLVGSPMYLIVTIPDIMYVVNLVLIFL